MQALSIEGVLQDSETVSKVHPCILRLGFKFADGSLKGGNTRAIALISALRQLIQVPLLAYSRYSAPKFPVELTNHLASNGRVGHPMSLLLQAGYSSASSVPDIEMPV